MGHKLKRAISMIMVVCIAASLFCFPTEASSPIYGKRYNIMLVVDGSGSLDRTDKQGMRYELVGDLLGVLENNGHNIGAIVFSGNTMTDSSDAQMAQAIMWQQDLLSLDETAPDGSNPKDYLLKKIMAAGIDTNPHGCTDIGTALLTAERLLQRRQKENGLESLVFLFSDGLTEFYYNSSAIDKVLSKSEENCQTATKEMRDNGIRLFGAYLHLAESGAGGKGRSQITIKDIVCSANGVNTSSEVFSQSYLELDSAEKLHSAVNLLLKFLGIRQNDPKEITIGKTTPWVDQFKIPGMGVDTMTIRLYSVSGTELPKLDVEFTDPDGNRIPGSKLVSISSRTYCQYQIDHPASGNWGLRMALPESSSDKSSVSVFYDPILSVSVGATLTADPDFSDLHIGSDARFTAWLTSDNALITDPAAYAGYNCAVEVVNLSTMESREYAASFGGAGMYWSTFLQEYGSFQVRPIFTCGKNIRIVGDYITYSLSNNAPEVESPIKVQMTVDPENIVDYEANLLNYVNDLEDGKDLTILLQSAPGNENAVSFNGSTLRVFGAKASTGTLRFSVQDRGGDAVPLEVQLTVNHTPEVETPLRYEMIVNPLAPQDLSIDLRSKVHDSEDGQNLNIAITGNEQSEDAFSFDGSVLVLKNDRVKAGKTTFSVTDSEGQTKPLELQLSVRYAPVVRSPIALTMKVNNFRKADMSVSLLEYIEDQDETGKLVITDQTQDGDPSAYEFDGETILLKCGQMKSRTLDFVVRDSTGLEAPFQVVVTVKDITIFYIIGAVVLLILIVALVVFLKMRKYLHTPRGELVASFPCGEEQEHISMILAVPGAQTKSKSNLYELVKRAIREKSFQHTPGMSSEQILNEVDSLSKEMKRVRLSSSTKRSGGKTVGAIKVNYTSKANLYNSSVTVNVGTKTVVIAFYDEDRVPLSADDGPFGGFGGDQNPFSSFGGSQSSFGGDQGPFSGFGGDQNPFGSGFGESGGQEPGFGGFSGNDFSPSGGGTITDNSASGFGGAFPDSGSSDTENPFGGGFGTSQNPFGNNDSNSDDTLSDLF